MKILLIRKKKLKRCNLDKLKEECGIFGVSNHEDSSRLVALGLHSLQHRGQEGCGIVSFDGKSFHSEKRQGLVGDHFTNIETIKKLPGHSAIGHNRYSTTGETSLRNIQPFFADLYHTQTLISMGSLFIAYSRTFTPAFSRNLAQNFLKPQWKMRSTRRRFFTSKDITNI